MSKENTMKIFSIRENPELMDSAAEWFHEKWGIPLEAYRDSMKDGIETDSAIPRWFVMMDGEKFVGGLGVIENDFHNRPDLTPNVCAVYVEEAFRCRGIAGELLNHVCRELAREGVSTLYLLTDHTGFYERYGWEFFCLVQGDGEEEMARMYIHREGQLS